MKILSPHFHRHPHFHFHLGWAAAAQAMRLLAVRIKGERWNGV